MEYVIECKAGCRKAYILLWIIHCRLDRFDDPLQYSNPVANGGRVIETTVPKHCIVDASLDIRSLDVRRRWQAQACRIYELKVLPSEAIHDDSHLH